MLMSVKCSAVSSIVLSLTFDDQTEKKATIAHNDLIKIEYNKNGCRRSFEGKVVNISVVGLDPKGWTITLDGSDDFESEQIRVSPMNILDIFIIRKADFAKYIETPVGEHGIMGLRINQGRLQYTKNGMDWENIIIDNDNIIIKDESGNVTEVVEQDITDEES